MDSQKDHSQTSLYLYKRNLSPPDKKPKEDSQDGLDDGDRHCELDLGRFLTHDGGGAGPLGPLLLGKVGDPLFSNSR